MVGAASHRGEWQTRGMGASRTVLLLVVIALLGATPTPTFTGDRARPQDDATLELGLLRNDLATLRTFRTRDDVWIVAAGSQMAWDRFVAIDLSVALTGTPAGFTEFARSRDSSIAVAGPDLAGGTVRIALGDRGEAFVAAHLPDLLTSSRGLGNLLNAPHPGRAHFRSGVTLSSTSSADIDGLYLPKSPRGLSRGLPKVPLFDLPGGGVQAYAVLAEHEGSGGDASSLRGDVVNWGKARSLALDALGPWPRREGNLTEALRSVRVSTRALSVSSGWYRTLAMAPSSWRFSEEKVRHPARVLAASAPVVTRGHSEVQAAPVGLFAWYTPLLLTAEEAPLWLNVPPKAFFEAVHGGELPFFRAGDDVYFLRGHLERWARGETGTTAKAIPEAEARELTRSWADKYSLRGLTRAADGPLPLRFVPVPESERVDLVDSRVAVRARVVPEDLTGWLKHFEAGLKQGKQAPVYSLRPENRRATLAVNAVLPAPPENEPPGAAESLGTQAASRETTTTSGSDGDRTLAILDFYPETDVCLTGGDMTAALAFDLDGVPLGETAKMRLEWDVSIGGRSVARNAERLDREAGTHEVEFTFDCPKEEGVAELYATLFVPGSSMEAEARAPLDVEVYGGRSWAALNMPSAKSCKEATFSGGGDEDFGMQTSAGLSPDQILGAVRGFQEQTLRCYRGGMTISGRLTLEMTVECDGRVTESIVEDDSTAGDSGFAQCVADTFKFAPFPAHDRDGGSVFQLPLLYE